MAYKSIIFDLDGTLLDTAEDLTDSINFVLTKYGYPTITPDEAKSFTGNASAFLVARCLPQGEKTEGFGDILREYTSRYHKSYAIKTRPYPGIMETLRKLKDKDIEMSIVSNKPVSAVRALSGLFFGDYISLALGDTPGIPIKPAPDLVLAALEKLKHPRESVLYVGDSEVDIETAENAGLSSVIVSWGFRGVEFLREKGAKIIIDDPLSLLDYV